MQGQEKGSEEFDVMGLLMAIASVSAKRSNQYLTRTYGLTLPQYHLLLAAVDHDSRTLGHLADDLACSRGNLTGVADRLERDGWVIRERSREDRRIVNISLTAKGQRISEIQTDLARHQQEWLLKPIEPTEESFLIARLIQIRDFLKDAAQPSPAA